MDFTIHITQIAKPSIHLLLFTLGLNYFSTGIIYLMIIFNKMLTILMIPPYRHVCTDNTVMHQHTLNSINPCIMVHTTKMLKTDTFGQKN